MVSAGGFYWLIAVAVVLVLLVPIHAAWYARHHPVQLKSHWNHLGVYAAYVAVAWLSNAILAEHRGEWQGFESFRTPSVAMSPTLEPGDFVIVDAWRYRHDAPRVSDVIAFRLPSDNAVYLKRVVALPGDQVEIVAGRAVRNGHALDERYLHAPLDEPYSPRDFAYAPRLGTGEYFVLGDLRDNSKDSRSWGPIKREWIIGRVEYRWLSLDGWKLRTGRFPVPLVAASP